MILFLLTMWAAAAPAEDAISQPISTPGADLPIH